MTSRELTSRFDFWSRGHLRIAVMHVPVKFGADIFIQCGVIDIFCNSRWRPPPSWICRLCEFGHSGVLVVWYLCSVPNLVQISVIVTSELLVCVSFTIFWSATKQRPHPQSVAEISRHSVLSGDRIRQCETSSGSRHKDTDQCL